MATYAPVAYTTAASNTQIDFDITFTFLRATDVVVSVIDPNGNVLVNGTDYDAELQTVNDGTFDMRVVQAGTLNTTRDPLAANHVVSIKRNTDISQIVTVFQDGASFKAADINAIITQLFDKIQEVEVSSGEGIGLTDDLVAFDAENKPLRNLGTPTANNDAVRKVDVDSGIGPAITTVAGIASDVSNVAADATDIGVVAADISGTNTIGTVAGAIANVNAVGNDIANINAVAADATDISVVAADLSGSDTIGTVAGIASAVSSVAADATDIGVVATDLSGSDTIGTVAGIASAVSNVSSISAAVTSVNGNSANINTVAGDTSAINTLATGTDSGGTAYLTHLANASTNAAAAQAALTAFNRTYLGAYSADPTVDGNGDALTNGDLYYNTTSEVLKFYNDTDDVWVTLNNSVQVNAATTLGAVGDANFGTLTENDFIVRDGSNPAKWVNKTPAQARASLGMGSVLSDIATNTTDIATNTTNIATNTSDIATNAAAIASNDTDITALDGRLTTAEGNITSNDTDITNNASAITTLQSQMTTAQSDITTNATAIATKQAAITTSSGTINAQSLTTYVTGDSGSVSVDVRKANPRTTTGTHTLLGGATLYYANAAATYDTASLTPGDIVTIYNEGGGTVTVNTGGTVSLFKDGEASAVTAAVTIGADTIATVTCVSTTKAIIAGSDLT